MSGTHSPSILLVDDQEPNRYWMKRALTNAGFAVAEAECGVSGLHWLQNHTCDLVLLDVGLPDLSGYEVCRRVKAFPELPPLVVLISARFTGSADCVEGLETGADGFLTSPLEPAELVAHVRALIRRRETEQQAFLASLRRSEERYRQLFDSAGDIIYNHDLQGRFTAWNRKGEELTGYTRADMVAMTADQLIAPEFVPLAAAMSRRKVAGELTQTTYEVEVIAKDGTRIPLEVSSQLLLQDGEVIGITGLARDIRERRQLQAQLLQSQKMEAVGLLAGGVAHDFNNMLAVINGYACLLSTMLPTDSPAVGPVRDGLAEIRQAGERAAALTRQLLAFSRKQILEPQVLHVGELLVSLERLLRPLIGEDIDLQVEIDPDVDCIRADPHQLEQVLVNLAVNSRDAMAQGGSLLFRASNRDVSGPALSVDGSAPSGSYVELLVRDSGAGMPPAVLSRIWEPFFTTKDVGHGTGLGLSTVYGIVRQSGGYITAESTVGVGSTFQILFPRVGRSEETAGTDCTPLPT